jgi:hypothetical protein
MSVAVVVLACLWAAFPAVASDPARSVYIVQFRAEPIATASRITGDRLHPRNPQAVAHRKLLDATERRVLFGAAVPDAQVGYRYRTTLAGFSAHLTAAEAGRIRQQPEVASIAPDLVQLVRPRRAIPATQTATKPVRATALVDELQVPGGGPMIDAPLPHTELRGQAAEFLGLPGGLWQRLGGPDHAGEDVVVGVIDTGIYPEHPSFADQPIGPDGTARYVGSPYGPPPAGWRGICQEGERFPATSCNNKLIGARFFVDGYGAANVADEDFLSPRDADGHGSGVASIAAGNYGVDPSYLGHDLGLGFISGIAPRARIAVYKALWSIPAFEGGGFLSDSDLAAAIDAAVADGVDILNLSIGGALEPPLPFTDGSTLRTAASLALLRAFDAGVLAVVAAGNSGPDPETVEDPGVAPWAISAGASALPTTFTAVATVSGGPGGPIVTAQGISPTPALPAAPLIEGAAAALPGADLRQAERCVAGSLDPAVVAGKVVLCRPSSVVIASATLFELGAAGGIFYFQGLAERYSAEDVWLPSVVVSPTDATAIRQVLVSNPNTTASFTAGTLTPTTTGDIVARSSGRGPTIGTPSILKPDLLAPGADIIMAHSPDVPPDSGPLFDFTKPGLFRPLTGTSLAVPIVVGAAALLLDLHPEFGPSELKSALMTTAEPEILEDDPVTPSVRAGVLDTGAGRIDPNRAADAGLVLTETTARFQEFLAIQDPARDPARPTLDGTDLNLPSIDFDPLSGPRSTTRTFTSTDAAPGTWRVSFEGLAGIAASADPAQLSTGPGESRTVQFAFDPTGARIDEYVDGAVILTNEQDGRTVRLPVVVRPEQFEAAEQLNFGTVAADGQAPLAVPTGYQGDLSAQGYGFAPPEARRDQTVAQDPFGDEDPLLDLSQPRVGVTVFDMEVPSGAQGLAIELGGAAVSDPLADLDLLVFHDRNGDGFTMADLIDSSEQSLSAESLLVRNPRPGAYRFSVRGFNADPVATFDLTTWLINDPAPDDPAAPPGPGLAITGDPVAVTPGGNAALTIEWRGLEEPGTYLGLITYHSQATPNPLNQVGDTIIAVRRA